MDAIFKALADPARLTLMDSLRHRDGQTLSELETQLDMTRFGVMKHLRVLEDATLIVTRKSGRFKHHFLNAVPLQEAIDRFIDPYRAKPAARGLIDLKSTLEGTAPMLSDRKPDFVMSTFINCTHDALWDALTRGEVIAQYHFASRRVAGDYVDGGDVVYEFPQGGEMLRNHVVSVDPKSRIEMDFQPNWGEDKTVSRCVYLVEPTPSGMKLTVEHYDLPDSQSGVADGWARFLSGLKTYLETGTGHRFEPEMGG